MTNGHLYVAPAGARGFDCNFRVTRRIAAARRALGESFCCRYIRRAQRHDYDLTKLEVEGILNAGLGLILVQHVAPEGWQPTEPMGMTQGLIAAAEVERLDLPPGVTVTLDLEGVKPGTPADNVIDFCNRWHEEVARAGFSPLLYVGFEPGLTALALYRQLRFTRYWGAYNLQARWVPAIRGVCMQQSADPNHDFDRDVVTTDALGGRPTVYARPGWLDVVKAAKATRATRRARGAGQGGRSSRKADRG